MTLDIQPGKFYRTRYGHKARIYATDGGGDYPIQGAVLGDVGWRLSEWDGDGRHINNYPESNFDIIGDWTEPCPIDWSDMPAWANWVVMHNGGTMSWSGSVPIQCTCHWSTGSVGGHIPPEYIKRKPTVRWTACKWQRPS